MIYLVSKYLSISVAVVFTDASGRRRFSNSCTDLEDENDEARRARKKMKKAKKKARRPAEAAEAAEQVEEIVSRYSSGLS